MRSLTIILLALSSASLFAAPVRTLPNLTSIVFYEGSSGMQIFTFGANSPELTTQLPGQLTSVNRDFQGLPNELYDVFYSNSDGTFNIDGEYVTVQATYTGPSSSGLNISAVQLLFGAFTVSFDAGPFPANGSYFADVLASHVPGSTAFVPGALNNAIDGNISTFTSMGVTGPLERMSITVGFDANVGSATPEPSSVALLGAGGLGLLALRWRRGRCG